MNYIKENLYEVKNRIEEAAKRAKRDLSEITLVGVTKTVDTDVIEKALEAGLIDIGENRVQDLVRKMDILEDRPNYHMIGHLQTNKVRDILGRVKLIHSLDRISLAKELNKRGKREDIVTDVLIQVNVSEEETKFGFKVEETIPFIEKIQEFENIRIKGLMTMAPHVDDEKILRETFSGLRKLSEKIESQKYKNVDMEYLSMGMTNDYEVAIEEGANIVRVGRAIFGERNY